VSWHEKKEYERIDTWKDTVIITSKEKCIVTLITTPQSSQVHVFTLRSSQVDNL